ncbi:hypothetical protein R1flu_019243 [Riccia fluitans]|uniref:Uncharacterized protein n=1 Tax=Riccia fluitans TaxID=41844 RepID=A0ABD1ZIF8_9MARC
MRNAENVGLECISFTATLSSTSSPPTAAKTWENVEVKDRYGGREGGANTGEILVHFSNVNGDITMPAFAAAAFSFSVDFLASSNNNCWKSSAVALTQWG